MLKPIYINCDYRTLVDIDKHPDFYQVELQRIANYWTDGEKIFWRYDALKADTNTFQVLSDLFAKDGKTCFMQHTKLSTADVETFEVLNNCFAKDQSNVWCIGGKFKPADIGTFEVCDDGINRFHVQPELRLFDDGKERIIVPKLSSGYAKDAKQVYFYDHWGKVKIVKKANPNTFVSNNDAKYAWDDKFVFYGSKIIENADPKTWKLVDLREGISKDAHHQFRYDKIIE